MATPTTPTPKHPRNTNAGKAYRRQSGKPPRATETTALYRRPHDSPLPTLTDADALLPLLTDDTGLADADEDRPFTNRQAALLYAYVRWTRDDALGHTGDPITDALPLCQSVGYAPASTDQAQALIRCVLQRIDEVEDTKRVSQLMGMGVSRWLRKVYQIANCGSPRVEVIAAKLWGLANGVFDDPQSGAGAQVIIEAAHESPDGARTAIRATLESSNPAPTPHQSDLIFTAKVPKVAQHRRKMLKKLD